MHKEQQKKIRVFEAFAGYGSQRMALRNIGIPFEIVGISEIEGEVIRSYAAIHTDFLEKRKNLAVGCGKSLIYRIKNFYQ